MDEDQAYRAMDLLVEADAQAKVQEAVFFAVADLLNLEVDLLFFDTTSTYFERDTEEAGEDAFRRVRALQGPPRRPAADRDRAGGHPGGDPGAVWCWPGNTNDQALLPRGQGRHAGLAARPGGHRGRPRVLLRREPGLPAPRRRALHRRGADARRQRRRPTQALSRQGRYQQRPRQPAGQGGPRSTAHPGVRFVICHNPERGRTGPKATRDAAVARVADRAGPDHDHPRPRRQAPDHARGPLVGPAATQAPTSRAREGRVRAARPPRPGPLAAPAPHRAAGDRPGQDHRRGQPGREVPAVHLRPATCRAEDVALGYKNLLEAERGFRDLKSTLELRPVFHRLEHRIRAHVLLCWLALLLIRVAERRTGQTWRRIATELGRLHAVTLTGPAGTVVHTTPLTTAQAGILRACQVPAPATVTALDPV